MLTEERKSLIAPCGIDCGVCEVYLCRDNDELKSNLLSRGISADKVPCNGCRAIDGNCPVIPEKCATYLCVQDHKVDMCHACAEFPCDKLNPAKDLAEVLPHNLKVFNLCVHRERGAEGLVAESGKIKQHYFKGKMKVGYGPVVEN